MGIGGHLGQKVSQVLRLYCKPSDCVYTMVHKNVCRSIFERNSESECRSVRK